MNFKSFLLFFIVVTTCSLVSCKSSHNKTSFYKNEVFACYYASKFEGKKTANGSVFSNKKYTASHKSLDFGTKVKVTNLENNKSVIVTINDRGPFSKNYEIDLSKIAFDEISHDKKTGILKVSLEILP